LGLSPASILYDSAGNAIGVLNDGSVYRVRVENMIKAGQGSAIIHTPTSLSSIVQTQVKNGGSPDLTVDGSGTPAVFTLSADGSNDTLIDEIRFILVCNQIKENGAYFGAIAALTNGVKLEVTYNNGTTTQLALLKLTEHFREYASPLMVGIDRSGTNAALSASFLLGGAISLVAASSDNVKVTIQDDLSSSSFLYFTGMVRGRKV
jgi:hypothetical protein